MGDLSKLAYPIEEAGPAVGVSRTRIFDAVRNNELTVRKAGKSSVIEIAELRRWLQALPTRGRLPHVL
jgi:hypothetical protein